MFKHILLTLLTLLLPMHTVYAVVLEESIDTSDWGTPETTLPPHAQAVQATPREKIGTTPTTQATYFDIAKKFAHHMLAAAPMLFCMYTTMHNQLMTKEKLLNKKFSPKSQEFNKNSLQDFKNLRLDPPEHDDDTNKYFLSPRDSFYQKIVAQTNAGKEKHIPVIRRKLAYPGEYSAGRDFILIGETGTTRFGNNGKVATSVGDEAEQESFRLNCLSNPEIREHLVKNYGIEFEHEEYSYDNFADEIELVEDIANQLYEKREKSIIGHESTHIYEKHNLVALALSLGLIPATHFALKGYTHLAHKLVDYLAKRCGKEKNQTLEKIKKAHVYIANSWVAKAVVSALIFGRIYKYLEHRADQGAIDNFGKDGAEGMLIAHMQTNESSRQRKDLVSYVAQEIFFKHPSLASRKQFAKREYERLSNQS